jgi:hypothetical protein
MDGQKLAQTIHTDKLHKCFASFFIKKDTITGKAQNQF